MHDRGLICKSGWPFCFADAGLAAENCCELKEERISLLGRCSPYSIDFPFIEVFIVISRLPAKGGKVEGFPTRVRIPVPASKRGGKKGWEGNKKKRRKFPRRLSRRELHDRMLDLLEGRTFDRLRSQISSRGGSRERSGSEGTVWKWAICRKVEDGKTTL